MGHGYLLLIVMKMWVVWIVTLDIFTEEVKTDSYWVDFGLKELGSLGNLIL